MLSVAEIYKIMKVPITIADKYQEFFNFMNKEHDLVLTIDEMNEIVSEVEKLKKINDKLTEISLPPFIKDEILGLDGEHFGVETLGNYHNARITWWSSFPKEWEELINWFEKIRRFLEEKFSEN